MTKCRERKRVANIEFNYRLILILCMQRMSTYQVRVDIMLSTINIPSKIIYKGHLVILTYLVFRFFLCKPNSLRYSSWSPVIRGSITECDLPIDKYILGLYYNISYLCITLCNLHRYARQQVTLYEFGKNPSI